MSWADLEAFLEHCTGRSAYKRLSDPAAVFDDPVIERLTSIEDWLETLHWREVGSPAEQLPQGAREWAAKQRRVDVAPPPKKRTASEIRAEIARREAAAAAGVASVTPLAQRRTPNPKAQAIRDEIASRIARAQ